MHSQLRALVLSIHSVSQSGSECYSEILASILESPVSSNTLWPGSTSRLDQEENL